MDSAEVTDMYEAAYLFLSGYKLQRVSCIPAGLFLSSVMSFSGPDIEKTQERFYGRTAEVNLYSFRMAYNVVNSHVQQAKKSYEAQRREDRRGLSAGGGEGGRYPA